jgi:dTDP-4-amino-4,6-dideoxygalactose transaminase
MSREGYELDYVREAFETNWIAPLGANVDGFEAELCKKVGAAHGAALVTGTAALHLALRAAGVGAGDVVFCQRPDVCRFGQSHRLSRREARLHRQRPGTWNMDPGALEEAFRRWRPKPSSPCTCTVCRPTSTPSWSFAARTARRSSRTRPKASGRRYKGRHTGTLGDYGVYSFNGNKIITTSGGGMVVSENAERIEKIRFWATQAKDPARHYQHSELGYNYRMSNIVAGIGRGQLKVLDRRVEQKRAIYALYRRELEGLPGVGFMPDNDFDAPNRWLSCLTLDGPVEPEDVMRALDERGIESRPIWKPLHLQPVFSDCGRVGGDVAERIFRRGVCLPSDTKMSAARQLEVIDAVKSLFDR